MILAGKKIQDLTTPKIKSQAPVCKEFFFKDQSNLPLYKNQMVDPIVNSVDTSKMPQYPAFHHGFHCLPEYSLRSHKYTKG